MSKAQLQPLPYLGLLFGKQIYWDGKGLRRHNSCALATMAKEWEVSVDCRAILVGAAAAQAGMNSALKALTEAGGVSTEPVTRPQQPPNTVVLKPLIQFLLL